MSGYSKMYVIGDPGGFMGADGVNPIEFMILVGDAGRQWLEPFYVDKSIVPIGKLRVIVPSRPDHPDSLLDACVAFCPRHFRSCPSLEAVEASLKNVERLDFDDAPQEIPKAWPQLREEARPLFGAISKWRAELVPIERREAPQGPVNVDLPFFAYGLFRPGQLAFFQLRDLVDEVIDPAYSSGGLFLRDGLPILDVEGGGSVKGALVKFLPGAAAAAYDRIAAMEPDRQYRWSEATVDDQPANLLVGRSPRRGSVAHESEEWNGWDDPLFTTALDVVEEALQVSNFEWDLKPLFRIQMAYFLLWSSIERYVSLRYHFGDKVMEKVRKLAGEPAFAEGLARHVNERREVYRADRPDKKEVLDTQNPAKALSYYYQVRSNMTHRGKGVVWDHERVMQSSTELLAIFREVLQAAEVDARWEGSDQ